MAVRLRADNRQTWGDFHPISPTATRHRGGEFDQWYLRKNADRTQIV